MSSLEEVPQIPSPEDWGWMQHENQYRPVWTTIDVAAKACAELIRCNCKSNKGCKSCKCGKSGMKCTYLCKCNCLQKEI